MMFSPRRPYISPSMQTRSLSSQARPLPASEKTQLEGLAPAEAAKLFSDLIKAYN